jgi:hypothetical protein
VIAGQPAPSAVWIAELTAGARAGGVRRLVLVSSIPVLLIAPAVVTAAVVWAVHRG